MPEPFASVPRGRPPLVDIAPPVVPRGLESLDERSADAREQLRTEGAIDSVRVEELDLHDLAPEPLRLTAVEASDVAGAGCRLDRSSFLDVRFDHCDFANASLQGSGLRRVVVTDGRFTGCSLADTSIRDVEFRRCRLDLVSLRFAQLERVRFVDCVLDEADFQGARVSHATFEGCRFTGTRTHGCTFTATELRGCDLSGLAGADGLRGVRIAWHDLVQLAPQLAAAVGIEVLHDPADDDRCEP